MSKLTVIKPTLEIATITDLKVSYDKPWKEMIVKACPTWQNEDLFKLEDQFPKGKNGPISASIISFGRDVESEEVIKYAEEHKMRPANPYELYAVAKEYPTIHKDLGRDYAWLVALTPCLLGGGRLVPYVGVDDGERRAYLTGWGGRWPGSGLFVLVPQV